MHPQQAASLSGQLAEAGLLSSCEEYPVRVFPSRQAHMTLAVNIERGNLMGEQGLKAIPTDELPVPAWSLLITENGDCKATLATEICTWQAHRGRGSVRAPRAQTRVSQSAGRGAYVAYELSETIGRGARSNHAHPALTFLGYFKETCLDRFFALAERVAQWEIPVAIFVQVVRDASG